MNLLDTAKLSDITSIGSIKENLKIEGIAFDSRRVRRGDIFFCKGKNFKSAYAEHAISKGAIAVCYEQEESYENEIIALSKKYLYIAFFYTQSVKRAMALLAKAIHDDPFSKLKSIAVTGTKGKTTTTRMICDIINEIPGCKCAVLGDVIPAESGLTTPESPDIYAAAERCVSLGYTHIVCELSSQAVKEKRVFGINFDFGCFLNFGRDHISPAEHQNEGEYFKCKRELFLACGCAVLNSASPKSKEIAQFIKENRPDANIVYFGFDKTSDIQGSDIRDARHGSVFDLNSEKICVTADGIWNTENALCASAVGILLGASHDEIFKGIAVSRIPGRMETLSSSDGKINIIVDYAHNEMSFSAVFRYADKLGKKITAIFGAPGSKGLDRRSELIGVASRFSDRIILTEDDPANENVSDICRDILKTADESVIARTTVIENRETAIRSAIKNTYENGEERVILILGKGNTRFMCRKYGTDFYAGDQNIAREALDEIEKILTLSELTQEKTVVLCVKDSDSLSMLFLTRGFSETKGRMCIVCPQGLENDIRDAYFNHGRLEKILDYRLELPDFDGEKTFYSVSHNEIDDAARDLAVKIKADIFAYIVPERGILLNEKGFVKTLPIDSARLIDKKTTTPYLSQLIYALDNGVGRCAVLDGRSVTSLSHMLAGADFDGSEIIR